MGNAPFGKIKWGKINLKGMKNDKKRQFNCPVTYKENNKKGKGKTLEKQSTSEGCVRGGTNTAKPQRITNKHRTEYHKKTANRRGITRKFLKTANSLVL